tara:strand:+ start:315 stop:623 length:309 start_codon:yes stop_codon:yes gene_type:complete
MKETKKYSLETLIDLIDFAVKSAKKDTMLWSSGYDSLRRIAGAVKIDTDEWSAKQYHLTYINGKGLRIANGDVPYNTLTDAIKNMLSKSFPSGCNEKDLPYC